MFAMVNLPGSSAFKIYGPASKKACRQWLAFRQLEYQNQYGGNWYSVYSPAKIITNKEAYKLRWADGSRIIKKEDWQ